MPSILTQDLKQNNANEFINALSRLNPTQMYVGIGKQDAWDNEELPDAPNDAIAERQAIYSDLMKLKKIDPSELSLVIRRFDWTQNVVYDQYMDNIDLIEDINVDTGNPYIFYVLVDETYVYKCLFNNNGAASTVKPTGTSVNTFETADGYLWKYMCEISAGDFKRYVTDDWLPIKYAESSSSAPNQWAVQEAAVAGAVETIAVTTAGDGYDYLDPPNVVISDATGSGSGATAVATVDEETDTVTKIIVTNIGSGYETPVLTIDPPAGQGAQCEARVVLAPLQGHGSNAPKELGAKYVMVRSELNGDDGGNLPINVEYRQMVLITDPQSTATGVKLKFNNLTFGDISNGDIFHVGNVIQRQGDNSAQGIITKFDIDTSEMWVEMLTGSFAVNDVIERDDVAAVTMTVTEKTTGVPLFHYGDYIEGSDVQVNSGRILYINNRTRIERKDVQNEELRYVITF